MKNDRTKEELLLAFYLRKFCQNSEFPSEIQKAGFNSKKEIIEQFYQQLGNQRPAIIEKRSPESFLKSVNATSFVIDDESKKLTEPFSQFRVKYKDIIRPWYSRPSKDIWEYLIQFTNLSNVRQSIGNDASDNSLTKGKTELHTNLALHESTQESGGRSLVDDLNLIEKSDIDNTTKDALVNARIGQGKFRTDVLRLWGHCCAVTKSATKSAIRASHIKPWSESNNKERLDPQNGIPLVASLDALFDTGLISFDDSGAMLASSLLSIEEQVIFGIHESSRLSTRPSKQTADYLAFHRDNCFQE